MIQAGALASARARLIAVLNVTPDDAVTLNLLGVINAREGQFRAAEHCFQRAIAAAPSFVGAYLNLGRLYQENQLRDPNALKESLAAYESALKVDPSNPEANYQAAFVLWRRSLFQNSLDRLQHLQRFAQHRPQALAVGCADYAGLKKTRQAQEMCDALLQQSDLAELDATTVLPQLLAQRQYKLAIRILAGLNLRGLASPRTLHQLALLYEGEGDLEHARATLERIADREPRISPSTLADLARVAYKQKDLDSALGYLAHARKLDPDNPSLQFFFGMICLQEDYLQEAYMALRRAAELKPDNAHYNYAAGVAMLNRRDVREAYPYLRKYCQLKPGDPRGHLALGAAYFYGNDPDLARKEIAHAAEIPQTAADARYFLGRLEMQEGNFPAAIADLRKAIEISPSYADADAQLGYALVKLQRNVEAEKYVRRALYISPQNYTANLSLMILYRRTRDPRASDQIDRFNKLRQIQERREREFLRRIEVQPF